MADIFISYARADRDKIERLASALESEGYSVWWDRHIEAGAEFSADIERELDAAKAIIVCWSEEGSRSRWVKDEANIAADERKLVAVTLDENLPPIGFRQYHAAPLGDWIGDRKSPAFQELTRALKSHTAEEAGASKPAPSSGERLSASAGQTGAPGAGITTPTAFHRHFQDPKMMIGAMVLMIMAIAALFFIFRGGGAETAAVAGGASVDRSKSIAVLPFDDFSADDNEWFADGLTEEILNSLARTPDLLVASRTSSFKYKDEDDDAPEIARKLGVEHILEGSVRRSGNRLRVTAQLIRASDGFHLWSENYDRSADDVIAIQEEIAIEIAKALKTAMDPKALEEMLSAGTRSVEAYEAYLQGIALYSRGISEDKTELFRDSRDAFMRAIEIDPDFAEAQFQLGLYWQTVYTLTDDNPENKAEPEKALEKTLQFFDAAIEAEPNAARKQKYEASRAIALSRFRDAISIGEAYVAEFPNDSAVRELLVTAYIMSGEYEKARERAREYEATIGEDEDQLISAIINYVWSKDFQNAARISRIALSTGTANVGFLYQAHRALLWNGDVDDAAIAMERYYNANSGASAASPLVGLRQACATGDRETAERLFEKIPLADETINISSRWLALKLLGKDDEAHDMLAPFDRKSAPYQLTGFFYYPYFDVSEYPNLQRVIEREKINRPPPVKIPFACPPPGPQKEASIAVLPFSDLSPEKNQQYFSDGIAEEILNVLARVDGLKVASRTSSFSFRDTAGKNMNTIASQLGVRHILEGSVRMAGDQVRITAQLIDGENDKHLWSKTYDGTLTVDNLFDIQDKISSSIVEEIGANIGLGRANTIKFAAAAGTDNLRAYDAYLEGRDMFLRRSEINRQDMIAKLEEAVELDPDFARAWSALAAAYAVQESWRGADRDYNALGIEAAKRALELDSDLAMPHGVIGMLSKLPDGRPDKVAAIEHLSRAIRLDPAESILYSWRGQHLVDLGFFERGEADLIKARDIDPLDRISLTWRIKSYFYRKDSDAGMTVAPAPYRAVYYMRMYYAIGLKGEGREEDVRNVFEDVEFDSFFFPSDAEYIIAALTEDDYDYDAQFQEFKQGLMDKGFTEDQIDRPIWLYLFKQFDKLQSLPDLVGDSIYWLGAHEDYLQSDDRYRLMHAQGLDDYWKAKGFPPQCRKINPRPDGRDYECD